MEQKIVASVFAYHKNTFPYITSLKATFFSTDQQRLAYQQSNIIIDYITISKDDTIDHN